MIEYFNKSKIKASQLLGQSVNYLIETYKQNKRLFSYSTAYGQIIIVLHNIQQFILFFIKDSLNQSNFATANRTTTIHGLAQLQGHNAMKGKSAYGQIGIRLRTDIQTNLIKGNFIFIPNYLKIRCKTNELFYLLDLGQDYIQIDLNNFNTENKCKIIEGELEVQSFTGTGKDLQSFQVQLGVAKQIDDDFIKIEVNSKIGIKIESLYDGNYNELNYLIKNSINGDGFNVVFGNKVNCQVPNLGEQILVHYLTTKGLYGNIYEDDGIVFEFQETGYDVQGNEINLNDYLNISNILKPNFGANAEPIELTKILAPNISRNFIIHDKKSIEYFLNKMNYFSTVKVFQMEKDNINTFNVIAIPRLIDRLSPIEDYFLANIQKFILNKVEKSRLLTNIHESEIKSANMTLNFIDPIMKYFSMNVLIDVFEIYKNRPVDLNNIEKEIRKILSNYLITNPRINKVPHSDIIRILDEIPQVDTVKVIFSTEYKEDLDEYGNIFLKDNEYAVCRGGFINYDGIEVFDQFNPKNSLQGMVNLQLKYSKQ